MRPVSRPACHYRHDRRREMRLSSSVRWQPGHRTAWPAGVMSADADLSTAGC